jgi:hypothetical protein
VVPLLTKLTMPSSATIIIKLFLTKASEEVPPYGTEYSFYYVGTVKSLTISYTKNFEAFTHFSSKKGGSESRVTTLGYALNDVYTVLGSNKKRANSIFVNIRTQPELSELHNILQLYTGTCILF